MKKLICILILTSIACLPADEANAQTGWYSLNSGTANWLRAVYFLNSSTGYACGDNGTILKTTNGGLSFSQASDPGVILNSIFFTSSNQGYGAGYADVYGRIVNTSNGGASWLSNIYAVGNGEIAFYSVYFVDADNGYIAGDILDYQTNQTSSVVLKTTNGGTNWTFRYPQNTSVLHSVFFTSVNTGYVVGTQGRILKTQDGGTIWSSLTPTIYPLNSVYFTDANTGYAAGNNGTMLKTTNAGAVWSALGVGTTFNLRSVYFIPLNGGLRGYTVGSFGTIRATTDGGASWTAQSSGVVNDLYSVFFTDSLTGYAVGQNGRVLKTINGGFTGISPIGNEVPKEFHLYQNYPNPFNPSTKFKVEIPKLGNVKIVVYNALGRDVTKLVNEELKPGTYEVEWDATNYPSGVYYYRLTAGDYTETKKMVLIR